jgi:hypothetical protein
MVFDAHDRAFRLFGGACRRGTRRKMNPSASGAGCANLSGLLLERLRS